jgi:hypothetical protein
MSLDLQWRKGIQPYPVAVALTFVFLILYIVCVGIHLLITQTHWPMVRLWEWILAGFTWISPMSFILGLLEIIICSFFIAYILIPTYNVLNNKMSPKEGEGTMNNLRFKPVAFALVIFSLITYILCILFDLILPQWAMYKLWEVLLPGFSWISWGSFFIGAVGVIIYALYISAVFVPIYNYFQKGTYPELK